MTKNKLKPTWSTLALILVATLAFNTAFAQLHIVKEQKDNQGNIITKSGNVGVGTEFPTEKLEVNGSIKTTGASIITGATLPDQNGLTSSFIRVGQNKPQLGTLGKSYIDLYPLDKAAGRLSSYNRADGKIVTALHNFADGPIAIRTWGQGGLISFMTPDEAGNAAGRVIVMPVTGNVGIGIDDPLTKFHVNGNSIIDGDVVAKTIEATGAAKKPGGGEFETTSDKRTKKNINAYTAGLDEILKLNPVTYNYNGKAGIEDTKKNHIGLIAQEFAEVAPYAVNTFNYKEEGSNKTEEYMSLDASSVKYMLVNAIKEQQAKIESLEEKLEKVAANGALTNPTENEISVLLEGTGTEKALLAQNTPNPFTTSTRIEYFIPADSRHTRMSFRDMNGKELKQVNIQHEGIGAIELSAKDLAAGIYSYVLYVNGDIVASKKMILKQ